MKSLILNNIGAISIGESIKPECKPGWDVVKVKAAGVCGSDIPRVYKTGAHSLPLIIGHEFSGEVVESLETGREGKRVGIFPLIPCMECPSCKQKKYEMCDHYNYLGSRCNGGFAEYVAVPIWNQLSLPEYVSFKAAAMMEPMAVAVHAMRQFPMSHDESVCVIGLGTIGLFLTMFLIDAGFQNIYVVGNKEAQKKHAMSLGLSEERFIDVKNSAVKRILELTGGVGAANVFECVGKNDTLIQAIEIAAKGGKINLVGNPYSDMNLSKDFYWKILRNQLKLSGTWNSSYTGEASDDWHYVLDRLLAGRINPEQFITHEFDLKDLPKGMEIMRDKLEDYVKIMCIMN